MCNCSTNREQERKNGVNWGKMRERTPKTCPYSILAFVRMWLYCNIQPKFHTIPIDARLQTHLPQSSVYDHVPFLFMPFFSSPSLSLQLLKWDLCPTWLQLRSILLYHVQSHYVWTSDPITVCVCVCASIVCHHEIGPQCKWTCSARRQEILSRWKIVNNTFPRFVLTLFSKLYMEQRILGARVSFMNFKSVELCGIDSH